MDTLSKYERSERMGHIRGKDTSPELRVRGLIHAMGRRFRLHRKDLPGRPHIVFPGPRKVIFVHGCFWHRHPDSACKLARLPKSRLDFWLPKLERNRARDLENQEQLKALGKPGLKVLHMADIDFRTSCTTFRLCLAEMRLWSQKNPDHSPVFVLIEPKIGGLPVPGTVPAPAFDAAAYEEFDRTIVETLGRDRVIAPDDVRGGHATLEQAVLAGGWPTVARARGKFLFLMLSPGAQLAALAPYLAGHEGLKGRMAFIDSEPGVPHAAFVQDDNALKDLARVQNLVRKGYLVRARADIDGTEARQNDTGRRDRTWATGAQIVSTDYYSAPNVFGNGYHLAPSAAGFTCNRVSAPRC